jgi:hypothetical protein
MGNATAVEARRVAEDHERVLEAIDVGRGRMAAPPKLERRRTQLGVESRSSSGADWDWFYGLSRAEQSRLRSNWFSRERDAMSPDEVAALIPLEEWPEHTRRADAGRALATGRVLASDRYGGLEGSHVRAGDENDHGYCSHCGRDDRELDVVGLLELAARLAVKRQTADQWRLRRLLPGPEFTVGGRPAWRWDVIEAWAAETGRLGYGEKGEQF